MQYTNISGYKFIKLNNLDQLREDLRNYCRARGIKGTILLAEEGVNAFLSAPEHTIDEFIDYLAQSPTGEVKFKKSPSNDQPFTRMLVKIKQEIIAVGRNDLDIGHHPAPYVSTTTFKKWLDEKRDIIVLDTRNDYEFHLGSFENSVKLDIENFRSFPEAIKSLPEEYKKKTIVSFCTGGIRCEKAAPIMIEQGFENVYQLEGGILQYFEDCGSAHYEGECFVFDKRVGVDANLQETETVQCFACRKPLTTELQQSDKYIITESCPYCYPDKNKAETKQSTVATK